MGIVHALDEQTVGALQLANNGLGEIGEPNAPVLVVEILCELRNAFCVRLGLKPETLGLKESLELLVVGDDAVVDDGKLPCGVGPEDDQMVRSGSSQGGGVAMDVPVGVAVETGGGTVGGPASVCDTDVGVEDLGEVGLALINKLPQLGDLAYLLEGKDFLLLVAIDGKTGRVVPSVLETGKSCIGATSLDQPQPTL